MKAADPSASVKEVKSPMMSRLCVVCKACQCVTLQCTLNKAQQSLGARAVQIGYARAL